MHAPGTGTGNGGRAYDPGARALVVYLVTPQSFGKNERKKERKERKIERKKEKDTEDMLGVLDILK